MIGAPKNPFRLWSAVALPPLLRIQPHHPTKPQPPDPVILRLSDEDSRRTSTSNSSTIFNSPSQPTISFRPLLRVLCALCVLCVNSFCLPVRAQNFDKPVTNIDEEVTAFAYAPNGNIVFSVRRMFKTKKYDLQRDDIWLLESGGKRKRLLEGQKFTRELLDDSGRELHPSGKDPLILEARNPLWLRDNQTLVYLTNEDTPQGLFAMQYLNVSSGPAGKAFEGRTFEGASRISGSNAALAVERSRTFDGPPRLQRLDLLSQDDNEVATLDAYAGGILVSPSGTRVAYFLDKEVLEIRDLTAPVRIARLRIGLGVLQWSADESRLYLKRTVEKKSADLVTFQVPELRAYPSHAEIPVLEPEPRMLLHGLTIREYSLSPDGRFLGVVLPGKRNLQIFGF